MTVRIPWSTLKQTPFDECLGTLTERINGGSDRALSAYVALRMIATRFRGALYTPVLTVSLSPEIVGDLVHELSDILDTEDICTALQVEPEARAIIRHWRIGPSVRDMRRYHFHR